MGRATLVARGRERVKSLIETFEIQVGWGGGGIYIINFGIIDFS